MLWANKQASTCVQSSIFMFFIFIWKRLNLSTLYQQRVLAGDGSKTLDKHFSPKSTISIQYWIIFYVYFMLKKEQWSGWGVVKF